MILTKNRLNLSCRRGDLSNAGEGWSFADLEHSRLRDSIFGRVAQAKRLGESK